MNLIVGLGNPGKEYENTRHSLGFMVVNSLADEAFTATWRYSKKFKADICHTFIDGQDVYLLKPQTYMNKSGESVREIVGFLDIPLERIWVIHDDLDLEAGLVRIRKEGSSGGHNGVQSIINNIGSERFPRFKIGIKTERGEVVPAEKFVLEKFSKDEQTLMQEAVEKTVMEIKKALREGIEHVSI